MDNIMSGLDESNPEAESNQQKIGLLQMYKKSATNKSFQTGVLKDQTIGPFLVLCLGSKCEKIVDEALQVFKIFASSKSNHQLLIELPYFTEAVKFVYKNRSLPKSIREDAEWIIRSVRKKPVLAVSEQQNENPGGAAAAGEVKKENNSSTNSGVNKSVTKNYRVTCLYVPSVVVAERRHSITANLVKIKGIISVTYNVNKNHCIVRAKAHIHPEQLGKTIANLGFICHLIKKNEQNEHVMVEIKPDSKDTNDSRLDQENLPEYPDSEEEAVPDNAVARKGEKGEDGTIIGAITGFFQKSFYW